MTDTTNTTAAKHYAKRDPEAQGTHYENHVYAMTTEGLHAKSAIAAELAHRDIEIERLRVALAAPAQAAALVSPSGDGFMAAVNEMDGLYATPAQAAAPDMTDAYAGARKDLSIWKKRALEAEAMNRKFAASVNSPSFMGEPAALAQAGENEFVSRAGWVESAMRVYLIAGDTEKEARECAEHLWSEADMDDLPDPIRAAMEDCEGRGAAQAAPVDAALIEFIEKCGEACFQRVREGFKGPMRWDIEFIVPGGDREVRGKTLSDAITKAIAARAAQEWK